MLVTLRQIADQASTYSSQPTTLLGIIQRRDNPILDLLQVLRRATGIQIGKRLAEAFLSDEPLEAGPDELFRI